ncbi:hypothetical protein ABZ192_34145 [Streptomyces sp. NPDC006235]|uniref:hypothetical protein n=1 Tax=Streptomyces sp. NPDC006235 TaxID=3156736 RepID=UPI0033BD8D9B
MNGIDHYKRAEKLLADAHEPSVVQSVTGEVLSYKHGNEERAHMIHTAHVHALLASSAATADATAFRRALAQANGMELPTRTPAHKPSANLLDDEDM